MHNFKRIFQLKNVMYIGYDTYHHSGKKGTNVGAIACSLNKELSRYYTGVGFLTSHTELVNNFTLHLNGKF